MASSSLDTASVDYNSVPIYVNDGQDFQVQHDTQFLFYTTPSSGSTEYIIIYPNTGSSTHAGKPTTQ